MVVVVLHSGDGRASLNHDLTSKRARQVESTKQEAGRRKLEAGSREQEAESRKQKAESSSNRLDGKGSGGGTQGASEVQGAQCKTQNVLRSSRATDY